MHRAVEFTIFFLTVLLLQVFLFDNISLSIFIHPLIYTAFIIFLPMELPAVLVLLCGLLLGVSIDIFSGMGGLNTITTLATSFLRYPILTLTLGKETVKEGGVPVTRNITSAKFLRYAGILIFIHCLIYFSFEILSWKNYWFALVKTVISAGITFILVFLTQTLLPSFYRRSGRDKI